jgi:hypothetical protein
MVITEEVAHIFGLLEEPDCSEEPAMSFPGTLQNADSWTSGRV